MQASDERPCRIHVFCGMVAAGKSLLATAWANRLHVVAHNSDAVRKKLLDIPPEKRHPAPPGQGIYNAEITRRTYDELLRLAEDDVVAGPGMAVLDASYLARAERDRVRKLADRLGCLVFFVYCQCGEEELHRRLDRRAADPSAVSDGRFEIFQAQQRNFEELDEIPPSQLLRLWTEKPVALLLQELADRLPVARET